MDDGWWTIDNGHDDQLLTIDCPLSAVRCSEIQWTYGGAMNKIGSRASVIGQLWGFMRARKKLWMGPIVFILLILGLVVVFAQGSALAPFIYTIF